MEEEKKYDNLQFAEQPVEYTDDNIRHLDDMEHIRVGAMVRKVRTVSMCC